jgi:hypothetical protein
VVWHTQKKFYEKIRRGVLQLQKPTLISYDLSLGKAPLPKSNLKKFLTHVWTPHPELTWGLFKSSLPSLSTWCRRYKSLSLRRCQISSNAFLSHPSLMFAGNASSLNAALGSGLTRKRLDRNKRTSLSCSCDEENDF